ncbi:MAG: peptidoglycan editing factor PgeF [Rhodocyclaceae bacterium]|nr:peptidoglycan editing factor PgeF [Rhodocyclaceae bacterium]
MNDWILPDWPAPGNVRALSTTRAGGVSPTPYASMNLGNHVGDDPECVARNRDILAGATGARPLWLNQVHGTAIAVAGSAVPGAAADGSVSRLPGAACAVMTADCLPVLLCDRAGTVVAAAHAGWRGLCAGVIESAVAAMGVAPGEVLAWLGPAIGPEAFEVGAEVRQAFTEHDPEAALAFREREGRWLGDLYLLARQRLAVLGVAGTWGGGLCTFGDPERFYSFRRDGVTGRMASLVWLSD